MNWLVTEYFWENRRFFQLTYSPNKLLTIEHSVCAYARMRIPRILWRPQKNSIQYVYLPVFYLQHCYCLSTLKRSRTPLPILTSCLDVFRFFMILLSSTHKKIIIFAFNWSLIKRNVKAKSDIILKDVGVSVYASSREKSEHVDTVSYCVTSKWFWNFSHTIPSPHQNDDVIHVRCLHFNQLFIISRDVSYMNTYSSSFYARKISVKRVVCHSNHISFGRI